MENYFLMILRQHTGVSPETFRLMLNSLTVTASFYIQNSFYDVNEKSQSRIHGGENPNSSWDTEARRESKLLQRIIPAKFGF